MVAGRGLVTSHLRAVLGAIILFTACAQIVVIRAANDKEVWRHFVSEKSGRGEFLPPPTPPYVPFGIRRFGSPSHIVSTLLLIIL